MIQPFFSSMITLLLAKFVLNDIPHMLTSTPTGNPISLETLDIIERARLKLFMPLFIPRKEEEEEGERRRRKPAPFVRVKDIGSYHIRMTRRDDTCSIRLYENLPGFVQRLRATWTGMGKAECDRKFEQVCEVVRQVRAERIITARRILEG